ncbi:MAG: hypothetical protein IT249_15440 [Chitinophagaceae bacterium]|nr:hypothetical protein [Chitinophagaceae bacterium]
MSKKVTAALLEALLFFAVSLLLATIAYFLFDISMKGIAIVVIVIITYLLVPRFQVVVYQSGERIIPRWFLSKFRKKFSE